jgi:hypothetical protein
LSFSITPAGPTLHSTTLRRECIPAGGTGVTARLRQKEDILGSS